MLIYQSIAEHEENPAKAGMGNKFLSKHTDKTIQFLLYNMGVTEQYTGFFYTMCAVRLIISDPNRLRFITKLIYPDVAKMYCSNWKAIERNIRTVASAAWRNNPLLLSYLSGFSLKRKPSNGYFLATLTDFCTRIVL